MFSSVHTFCQIGFFSSSAPEIAASHQCVHLTATNKRHGTAERGGEGRHTYCRYIAKQSRAEGMKITDMSVAGECLRSSSLTGRVEKRKE